MCRWYLLRSTLSQRASRDTTKPIFSWDTWDYLWDSVRTHVMAMRAQILTARGITDIVAFLMIAVCSYKSSLIYGASGLFERLVRDATVYFLVIVWVHLTVMIFTSTMGDVSPICPLLVLISDRHSCIQSRILRLFPAM